MISFLLLRNSFILGILLRFEHNLMQRKQYKCLK